MNAATSFYQLLTQVSFTLLGLWFVVEGLAHGGWRSAPERHRATLHIALHFVLPGAMGLGAVLAGDVPAVWRVTFLLGAVVGFAESLDFLRAPHRPRGTVERILASSGPVRYTLVAVAALVPTPLGRILPLQIEGMATALVFLAGLVHLWLAYAERPSSPSPGGSHGDGEPDAVTSTTTPGRTTSAHPSRSVDRCGQWFSPSSSRSGPGTRPPGHEN